MKYLNKLLVLFILIVIFMIVDKLTGVLGIFESHDTLTIQKTSMDFGREIFGNKISIRDNIRIQQDGEYKIDGEFLVLGNERKSIEVTFLAELGYFIEDIIKSEKVDSFRGNDVVSRTIIVELPMPDTLSFIEMRHEEKSNEWFWEGWYKGAKNIRFKSIFLNALKENAYAKFAEDNMNPNDASTLIDASMTVLNYINNGYKIGNEAGFDYIIATFKNETDRSVRIVKCNFKGNCKQETIIDRSFLN